MTNALRFPAADPQTAAAFFAAELAFEADPDDVHRDMQNSSTQDSSTQDSSTQNSSTQDGDTQESHAEKYVLVETRGPEAFARKRIPGAINLPYRDLPERVDLDPDLVYICYCESFQCNAATKGALALASRGFRVKRLAGGITAWEQAGYPVESDEPAGVSEVACHC